MHLAERHCLAVLEVVGVDDSFNLLSLLEYHMVGSGEITLFKCVLRWSVTEEQVGGLTALVEVHLLVVVLVLLLGHDHLCCLWLVLIAGG